MFCALSGGSLSWSNPVFSRFTAREHAKLHRMPFLFIYFFHSHMLRCHSKAQLPTYCGKRAFLGVAKNWKVTLDRVPWFGRHVENLGDVIIYRVLVVARTDNSRRTRRRRRTTTTTTTKQQKKMKVRQWWKSDFSFVSKIQLKSVISVCKRAKKQVGITDAFYGRERDKKISQFSDLFILKRRGKDGEFAVVKSDAKLLTRYVKGVPFANTRHERGFFAF